MSRCQARNRQGEPCKNEAVPGSSFCRHHQPKEGEDMLVVTKERTVRLRYQGSGTYTVGSFTFTPREREQEVPERLAEFLLDTEPELFSLADRKD
ncbi:MAG: hypothetical protein ABDI20_08640 [Candidatus Bipolaricaulaceae bacterium]